MKMPGLIEGLDPWWIPSDVNALNEGRKVAEEKRV
jgi:hypothetical protein